jgi:hypothetical protein
LLGRVAGQRDQCVVERRAAQRDLVDRDPGAGNGGRELQVEDTTPEPLTAARALVALVELLYDARLRHASAGLGPRDVQARANADIDRGARLLETGMWSLQLMVEGRRSKDQIREAAVVAERARQQVLTALRGARRSWKGARDEARAAGHEVAREARQQAAQAAREARQQSAQAAREAARQARESERAEARTDARDRRKQ